MNNRVLTASEVSFFANQAMPSKVAKKQSKQPKKSLKLISLKNEIVVIDREEEDLNDFIFGSAMPALTQTDANDFYIDNAGIMRDVQQAAEEDKVAWEDEDELEVDIETSKRLRKLKTDFEETRVSSKQFESRLRSQFEKMNPTPEWAQLDREKEDEFLLQSTDALIANGISINSDRLEVLRLKDANQNAYSKV